MKLFYLEIKNDRDRGHYDQTQALVVRAKHSADARRAANLEQGTEGSIWTDPGKTTCKELTTKGPAKVICVDFYEP